MKNDLCLKILRFAYNKKGANFTRKDLQDAFNLSSGELEKQLVFFKPMKITDRLIDSNSDGRSLYLTSKGMIEAQKYFNKKWWEKTWVQLTRFPVALPRGFPLRKGLGNRWFPKMISAKLLRIPRRYGAVAE